MDIVTVHFLRSDRQIRYGKIVNFIKSSRTDYSHCQISLFIGSKWTERIKHSNSTGNICQKTAWHCNS